VSTPSRTEHRHVVVVGSGFAGICMGIKLKESGRHDFVILEKADDLGGTWRDNTYPGATCDVESHLYSYSFAPKPDWSRMFSSQQEIWDYLRSCAERYGVTPHIRYGQHVTGARYDEGANVWRVEVDGAEAWTADALVTGVGALHHPRVPALPGAGDFEGVAFHSADWRHDVDLAGKRVAVLGTGASAIQFVPEIADTAAQVDVYQRTPPWVIPRSDRPISDRERTRFARFPLAQRASRTRIYWTRETYVLGFVTSPRLMKGAEKLARRHIARQVTDPDLAARVTPDYQIGCKRILISNDWYPTLQRDDVELIDHAATEITPDDVVAADGTKRPADVIIYGTGFVAGGALTHLDIVGRRGRRLDAEWTRDGENAYFGMTVHGFPNLFLLLGPNSGLGHSSMIFMIEAQVAHVIKAMGLLDRTGYVEVRDDVQGSFAERVQGALRHTVWSTGCTSWYLDANGRNVAIWPWSSWRYWLTTRLLRRNAYVVEAPTGGHESDTMRRTAHR
jgi:cation diffusion facilitator CzcD-associated flavoprotein CzcO